MNDDDTPQKTEYGACASCERRRHRFSLGFPVAPTLPAQPTEDFSSLESMNEIGNADDDAPQKKQYGTCASCERRRHRLSPGFPLARTLPAERTEGFANLECMIEIANADDETPQKTQYGGGAFCERRCHRFSPGFPLAPVLPAERTEYLSNLACMIEIANARVNFLNVRLSRLVKNLEPEIKFFNAELDHVHRLLHMCRKARISEDSLDTNLFVHGVYSGYQELKQDKKEQSALPPPRYEVDHPGSANDVKRGPQPGKDNLKDEEKSEHQLKEEDLSIDR